MPLRLAVLCLALAAVSACTSPRFVPREPAAEPLPAGIVPLTVEQDEQLRRVP